MNATAAMYRLLRFRSRRMPRSSELVGATSQLEIPGDFLDPRSTWVSARPADRVLTLILDYWSEEWAP